MKKSLLGFTLVEMMIVVSILALLVSLGVPGYLRSRNKSRQDTCVNNLRMIEHAADQYRIDNNLAISTNVSIVWLWPSTTTAKDVSSYINKQLACPSLGAYFGGNTTTGVANTDKTNTALINANGFPHCVTGGTITENGTEHEHSIEAVDN